MAAIDPGMNPIPEQCRSQVVHPRVGLRQLEPRLAELGIELDGARVFDDGERIALFSGVLVAALQVPDLLGFRVAAGRRQQRREKQREKDAKKAEKAAAAPPQQAAAKPAAANEDDLNPNVSNISFAIEC